MISFPYTSVKTLQGSTVSYDRAVNSKVKRLYNKLRYKQGVTVDVGGGFQVVADTGMNVKVMCNGAWGHVGGNFCYEEAESRVLAVQAPDTTYDRIDLVVLRNDISQEKRAVDLYVVQGTPASAPEKPALTNTPEIQEICIATLFITKNVNTISQDRITDTRLDPEVCGILTNAFGDIDASAFFSQINALIKKHQEDAENQIKELQAAIEAVEGDSAWMMKSLYDPKNKGPELMRHPIGYIFDWAPVEGQEIDLSTPEKVAQHFGYGTWKEITGVFTFARKDGYEVGSTGGEENHTLTEPEMPSHTHSGLYVPRDSINVQGGGADGNFHALETSNLSGTVKAAGGGQPHNNMPPYLTVYKWQRIA